jgi:hypothetical protein
MAKCDWHHDTLASAAILMHAHFPMESLNHEKSHWLPALEHAHLGQQPAYAPQTEQRVAGSNGCVGERTTHVEV